MPVCPQKEAAVALVCPFAVTTGLFRHRGFGHDARGSGNLWRRYLLHMVWHMLLRCCLLLR